MCVHSLKLIKAQSELSSKSILLAIYNFIAQLNMFGWGMHHLHAIRKCQPISSCSCSGCPQIIPNYVLSFCSYCVKRGRGTEHHLKAPHGFIPELLDHI